jgi:hypothetical protein
MVQMRLHQDVEGKKAGETADVPPERADFLEQEGYAVRTRGGEKLDGVYRTSVPADKDPRLAENAEAPNTDLRTQMAEGLGLTDPEAEDADDVRPALEHPEDYHVPELNNAEGDFDKGMEGKVKVEEKAVAVSEDADVVSPEVAGETPEIAKERADKVEQDAIEADEDEDVVAPEVEIVVDEADLTEDEADKS